MVIKLLILGLLLPFSAYAGWVKKVDFLYSSGLIEGVERDYLEVTVHKEGECRVAPVRASGKRIVVDLKGCRISRPYSLDRRGGFVRGAKLIPLKDGCELLVNLYKPGVLKVSSRKGEVRLKVVEGGFVRPKVSLRKSEKGEEVVIDLPAPVNPLSEKRGNSLFIFIPRIKLEPGKEELFSSYVKSVEFSNYKEKGVISLSLSPQVAAVEVLHSGKRLSVKLIPSKEPLPKQDEQGITLHFTNADVRSVVRAIASFANVNVVFDPEVNGKVNVNFKNPVPWREALRAVLEPLSLTYVETSDYIRILPLKKLLKEKSNEPLENHIVSVNYVNASDLVKSINGIIGDSKREKVTVNEQTNSLLLKVTPTHYRQILNFLKRIDRPRKQVLVKAKIVEVSSKAEKDLGFTWYVSGYNRLGNSVTSTYAAGSYGFNTEGFTPLIDPNSYMNVSKIPVMDSTLALGILNRSQTLRVELALKALEIDGKAQVVSSPKVLTLDNQEAVIEQGVEIPYRELTYSESEHHEKVKFKKASLILKARPHVTSDGNVLLDLELHNDSPNTSLTVGGEPAIDTRNVKSKVLIRSGDTVVIGGIYVKEKRSSSSAVPGFSRIPLLGWLFRNSQTVVSKRQMIIFITPVVVESGKPIGDN